MNRRLAAVFAVLALTAGGCRTTATVAYSYPQANPNDPNDCANQCSGLARTEGRESFVSCIRNCPGVSERDGSCGDQSPMPGFACVDEEHGKFAVGRTIVLAIILGVVVLGAAGAAAAYGATHH